MPASEALTHRAARALLDSKPADARALRMRVSLHAAPLEAEEPAQQLTREQLDVMVGTVSAHHRVTAAGMEDVICCACHSPKAALDVTLELLNFILSGVLPREAFLLGGL